MLFNEEDDWSHFVAGDSLAENMVILDNDAMTAVFGNAPVATFYELVLEYDYDNGWLVFDNEDGEIEEGNCELSIYEADGDLVTSYFKLSFNSGETILDINSEALPAGRYTAKLKELGKTIASTDFVIDGTSGDVNGDLSVTIVDALLIAQFYVGLEPEPFFERYADVNGDGAINIVDALLVAQYYVGLIDSFPRES